MNYFHLDIVLIALSWEGGGGAGVEGLVPCSTKPQHCSKGVVAPYRSRTELHTHTHGTDHFNDQVVK